MANYETGLMNPWNHVPKLDRETEKAAARATLEWLREMDVKLAQAMSTGSEDDLENLHEVYEFSRFKEEWLPFIIPAVGRGDVQIEMHDGLVKIEETGIPALWRMQMGKSDCFVLSRLPLCVRHEALKGEAEIGKLVNESSDIFAAPAIVEELREALKSVDFERLPQDPAYMVELNRQPLSPGDARALLSTLGRGEIEVRIAGFADSKLFRTRIKGVWHSKILNNAGKELLDAYVCAMVPPEVTAPFESFADARVKIGETIEWITKDLEDKKETTVIADDVMDYAKKLMEGI